MAGLGSLVVSLEANVAKFQSDMGKAVTLAEGAMGRVSRAVAGAQKMLVGLGAAYAIEKTVSFGKALIDSVDQLEQLHIQTGLSVEALSAMQAEAAHVGTDLEFAAAAFDKLQKNAFMAAGGNAKLTQAFKAIGLSAKDLRSGLKDPDALMLTFAQHMEQYTDDGNKTAEMMVLMGKSGAQATEFIHQMAIDGYKNANATAEQAKQAREFNAALADWTTSFNAIARSALLEILPALSKVAAVARVSFAILAVTASNLWATLKYDAVVAFNFLSDVVMKWAHGIGNVLAYSPIKGVANFGKMLKDWGSQSGVAVEAAYKTWQEKLLSNGRIMQEAVNAYVEATSGAMKLGVKPAATSIQPPTDTHALDGLRRDTEQRIKILNDAIAAQDEMAKASNKQLDVEYAHGLASLADYADHKTAVLEDNFTATQAIYDGEIAIAQAYAEKLKGTQQEALALGVVQELMDKKTADGNRHLVDRIALTEKLTQDGMALAKQVEDIAIAFETMNGNTEAATALQTELDDGLLKQSLLVNHLTADYNKLLAVEENRRMRASRSATDGIKRSIDDYKKSLADVAKSTESITGKLFTGLEDALVNFVQTGKLSFKSLIDSMLADLIRLFVQQQIMRPLMGILGAFIGGIGGSIGSSAGAYGADFTGGFGGYAAEGGPVTGGMSYMVGERGRELFTPSGSGTITPNSALGGGGDNITINHVTNVDARGAQEGQAAQLAEVLKRNNAAVKSDIIEGLRRRKYRV